MKKLKKIVTIILLLMICLSSFCYADLIDPRTGKSTGHVLSPQERKTQAIKYVVIGLVVAVIVVIAIVLIKKQKNNRDVAFAKKDKDTDNK